MIQSKFDNMKMTVIPRINLPKITVRLFSDIHVGSSEFYETLFEEHIEEVSKTPDMFAVFLGDILHYDLKAHRVGNVYMQKKTPYEQERYALRQIEKVKDKSFALLPGNHENRSQEDNRPIERIAEWLDIPFCEGEMYVKIPVGRDICYTLYGIHGFASGRNIGSIANALERMPDVCDADIYAVGHAHKPLHFTKEFMRPDLRNNNMMQITKHFIGCKSYQGRGEYPKRLALPATNIGYVDVELDGQSRNIFVKL